MEKKNYIKITFKNCGLEYDYTICEFWQMGDYLDKVEPTLADDDPHYHEKFGKPEITIEPILLTEKEYSDFVEKMESEA